MEAYDENEPGWAVVHQAAQRLTHVVPVGDAIRHEVLVDRRRPLRLRDGVTLSCVCGPVIERDGHGNQVVIHHPLARADRGDPPGGIELS